jgi:hypothetical protein
MPAAMAILDEDLTQVAEVDLSTCTSLLEAEHNFTI